MYVYCYYGNDDVGCDNNESWISTLSVCVFNNFILIAVAFRNPFYILFPHLRCMFCVVLLSLSDEIVTTKIVSAKTVPRSTNTKIIQNQISLKYLNHKYALASVWRFVLIVCMYERVRMCEKERESVCVLPLKNFEHRTNIL